MRSSEKAGPYFGQACAGEILGYGHLRGTFEHDAFVDLQTRSGDRSSKDGWGMHHDTSSSKNVSFNGSADDTRARFDLGFDFGSGVNYQGVLSEYLSFETPADAHCAFKSKKTLK